MIRLTDSLIDICAQRPTDGGATDGDRPIRKSRTRRGVRLLDCLRRLARAGVARGGEVRATAPRIQPLPVRDRDAARRRAARLDALCTIVGILAVVALSAWCAGLIGTRGNVYDAARYGERPVREEVERG